MGIRDIWPDPVLINTVGHCAGVLLFAVTIALLVRIWRTDGIRTVRLPLAAAGLALGWNLGSLIILASPTPASDWTPAVIAASFSMLTMLPAVLLHVTMQGRQMLVIVAGYCISSLATILHIVELFPSERGMHHAALLLVAVGFGALAFAAFFAECSRKAQTDRSQCLALICLLLFAGSFLHFGYHHAGSPWAAEITWHHIGIPVALLVLLRDGSIAKF